MSADTMEQDAAAGGDDDLRARYLPVSRKELRRRREAERRAAEQSAEPEAAEESTDELARIVEDTSASEGDALNEDPVEADDQPRDDAGTADAGEPAEESETVAEPEAEAAPEAEAEDGEATDDDASADRDELADDYQDTTAAALPVILPAPSEAARPEEEIADAMQEDAPETTDEETETDAADSAPEPAGESVEDDEPEPAADADPLPEGSTRRIRRLLRETESIPRLSPELMAELDATNAEIAVIEDPTRVDPELLKKQQALAAKAMQANQERMRKEQAAAETERRRRSRERPESQVLTEKMLRDSHEQDPADMEYFTGQIEPVHAQGAHGLELNEMIDITSRQASRRNSLMWIIIILAVLLVAAIAVGVYITFFPLN